jgi:tungstate transport system permease protein
MRHFPMRDFLVGVFNAMMGLPPVVVGLLVYLHLSRSGPFGWLGLLYTPQAMVIAQMILITPIIIALSCQVLEDLHEDYKDFFR